MQDVTQKTPMTGMSASPNPMPDDIATSPARALNRIELATSGKPVLKILSHDLPAAARELRDLFANSGSFFDRGVPVRLVWPSDGGPPIAVPLNIHNVVIEAHRLSQPIHQNHEGDWVPLTLPDRIARIYLSMVGDWYLPPLSGISTAPLLANNGDVLAADGYDRQSTIFSAQVLHLTLKPQPTRDDAKNALARLRHAFRTFPFADASQKSSVELGTYIDLEIPPSLAESAFLHGLMTAVVRPSISLAPGLMVTAPAVSGAGSGKGLLVRAICLTAFGLRPRAFTAGGDRQELDKRIAAELVEAHPILFLDNVNGATLTSDLLASVLTERPARVRVLGKTRMVQLNSTAFVAVTGNGLSVSLDLARRFIVCEFDAKCEDPEQRPFVAGFLDQIANHRSELLAAALTIWRWGRQNSAELTRGQPLGSFEEWCQWVRDPLLTLGCHDPVEQLSMIKAKDPNRQLIAELFNAWWEHHKGSHVKVADLATSVRIVADPHARGRQYLATFLSRLAGTRAGGFVLTRQEAVGKWSASTYVLRTIQDGDSFQHDHEEKLHPRAELILRSGNE
jgi:hypothetical protein